MKQQSNQPAIKSCGGQWGRAPFLPFDEAFVEDGGCFKRNSSFRVGISHRPVAGVVIASRRLRRSIPRFRTSNRSASQSVDEEGADLPL